MLPPIIIPTSLPKPNRTFTLTATIDPIEKQGVGSKKRMILETQVYGYII